MYTDPRNNLARLNLFFMTSIIITFNCSTIRNTGSMVNSKNNENLPWYVDFLFQTNLDRSITNTAQG